MSICIGSIFNGNRLAACPPENRRLRGAAIASNGSISGAFSQGQDKLTLMENQAHLKASRFGLRHTPTVETRSTAGQSMREKSMLENRVKSSFIAFKLVKGAQMRTTYAAALSLFLVATPALADDESEPVTSNGVAFTCVLEGYSESLGGHDGYKIVYTSAKTRDNCDVTCAVTKRNKSTYSKSFSHGVSKGATPDTRVYFDGESGLKGAPISNPTILSASCS
jgi:hypothetical protein